MSDEPKRAIDLKAAYEELREAQRKIDEIAKKTVDSVKRLVEVRESLVPGASPTFESIYGEWYRKIERDLTDAGFRSLGQYRNVNKKEDTTPERDAYYQFALSGDRTVIASWFLVVGKEPRLCVVLGSVATDGAVITTSSGIMENGLPVPPNRSMEHFPADTPIVQLLADHRAHLARNSASRTPVREFSGMEDILADRLRQANETAAFRREIGLGLFEPYLRTLSRGKFDEKGKPVLESILAHPEWWTGAAPAASPIGGAERLHLSFLMTGDASGERRVITSFGLARLGLPELHMRGVAANHCRAAQFLMDVVGRRLAAHAVSLPPSKEPLEDRLGGTRLTISRDDVLSSPKPDRFGRVNRAGAAQTVTVRLESEEFGAEPNNVGNALGILSVLFKTQRAPKLLTVCHPDPERREGEGPAGAAPSAVDAFTGDEWLRMSCERLGLDVPSAKPFSAFRESMDAASRRAVDDLPAFRARLSSGLADGHVAMIKTGLEAPTGAMEYVWVQVVAWKDDEFVGMLAVEPAKCPGYAKGQLMHVADADVFDRAIFSANEAVEQPLTDAVAMDFGVDLGS